MPRILSGGGKTAAGKPNTQTVGRPGFGSVSRGFRQAARVLSKRDPADGILNTPMSDITLMSLGGKASYTTALTGTNNDLKFTAQQPGTEPNAVRVRYVDPAGNNQALAVSVSGNDITVSLATGSGGAITSTAAQVKAAVNLHDGANDLVSAGLATGNDGTGVVTAMAFQTLAGGTEGEMRRALPPGLAPAPGGANEQNVNAEIGAPISRRAGVQRFRNRGSNRRLRKR